MKNKVIETWYRFFEDSDSFVAAEVDITDVDDGFHYEYCGEKGYRDVCYAEADIPKNMCVEIDPEHATADDIENMLYWFRNESHKYVMDNERDICAFIKYGEGYYCGDRKKIVVPVERLEVI